MGTNSNQYIDQNYISMADASTTSSFHERPAHAADIDAQAITTQALHQLQDGFPTLCHDERCAVLICHRDMQDMPIIYVSPAFKDLTGYDPLEVLGQNCRFLQRSNDLSPGRIVGPLPNYNGFDPNHAILKQKIDREETAYVTIINYHKDGHAFLNGLTIAPVTLNGSRYYVGFPTNVSSQLDPSRRSVDHGNSHVSRRLLDALQTSTNRGLSTLDNVSERSYSIGPLPDSPRQSPNTLASDGFNQALTNPSIASNDSELLISMLSAIPGYVLFVITPSGRILFLSKNVESLLGYTLDHLYGCSFFNVVHSQDLSAFRAELHKLTLGGSCHLICRMSTAEGAVVYMEFRSSHVSSTSMPTSYIVLSAKKISPVAIAERHLAIDTADQRSVLWAKISMSGLILHGTSTLRSLFHATQSLEQPSEAAEVIGLTFQSRLCHQSRKVFEDALITMSQGSTESVTIQHCFQRSDGNRLVMISNMLLAEDNFESTAISRPSFILIRLHYPRKDRNSASHSNSKRRSKDTVELTSGHPCDRSCIAIPRWQPNWPLVLSNSEASHQHNHPPGRSTKTGSVLSSQFRSQHQHEPDSNLFGFDPPSTSGLPNKLVSLLPQDRGFCWQYTVHSLAVVNQDLKEELHTVLASLRSQRRRKRAKIRDQICVVCGTSDTPEWRKGPSGDQNLCNRCGLKYAKTRMKHTQLSPETDGAQQNDETTAGEAE